jgi:hypothetical protein
MWRYLPLINLPPDDNDGVFGYQSRYAEYKFKHSTVHGDFRDTLDFWHLAQRFQSTIQNPRPNLNEAFIKCDPSKRVFAVEDGSDHLWIQVYHNIKAIRLIPYFSEPF